MGKKFCFLLSYIIVFLSIYLFITFNPSYYLVAATKNPAKANQIQELLTTKNRSTTRILITDTTNNKTATGIKIDKISSKKYSKVILEILNSPVFDETVEIPIDVRYSKNINTLAKRAERGCENVIKYFDGVKNVGVYIILNKHKKEIENINVYYETIDKQADDKLQNTIEKYMQAAFRSIDPDRINVENISLIETRISKHNQALGEYETKNYKKALKLLEEAQAIEPLYDKEIENLKNIINLEEKIAKNPNDYKLYIKKADIEDEYGITFDVQAAAKDYEKAIELNPQAGVPYEKLGDIYAFLILTKDNKKAIEYYQKAIEINGDNDILFEKLGLQYQQIGDPGKALEWYNKIQTATNREGLLYDKAECYAKLKKYDKAIILLDKILSQNDDENFIQDVINKNVYYNFKAKNYRKAMDDVKNCSVWVCKVIGIFKR